MKDESVTDDLSLQGKFCNPRTALIIIIIVFTEHCGVHFVVLINLLREVVMVLMTLCDMRSGWCASVHAHNYIIVFTKS